MGGGQDGLDHRLHDGAAGLIALYPRDAGSAVGGLQALGEPAEGVTIKGCAEIGEMAHGGGAFRRQDLRHCGIDEAGAGQHGVSGMQGGIVITGQGCGHAPLRPGGGAPLAERGVCNDEDFSRRGGQGGGKAR